VGLQNESGDHNDLEPIEKLPFPGYRLKENDQCQARNVPGERQGNLIVDRIPQDPDMMIVDGKGGKDGKPDQCRPVGHIAKRERIYPGIDISDNDFAEEIDGKKSQERLGDMNNSGPKQDFTLIDSEKGKEVAPESMPDISCPGYFRKIEVIDRDQMVPHIIGVAQKRVCKKNSSQCNGKQKVEIDLFWMVRFDARFQSSPRSQDRKSPPSLLC
jgi:hypothetical protein